MSAVLQIVLLISVFLLIIKLIPALRQYLRIQRMTRDIPGPPGYPMIGSLFYFNGPIEDLFDKFMTVWKQYGSIFKVWLGPACFVLVTDADDLEVVFTSPYLQGKMPLAYIAVTKTVGPGLLILGGEKYHQHRKAITASLHLEILKDFSHLFNKNAQRLAHSLRKFADSGEVFDVHTLMGHYTNLNVCETLLSTNVAGMEAERDAYMSNISKASQMTLWIGIRPWCWIDTLFKVASPAEYREFRDVCKGLHNYVGKVLDVKWRQANDGKLKPDGRNRETFLEKFLRSEESSSLTKQELKNEVNLLMFAASDTTVQLLCFFMVAMSLHGDIQEKVQQEMDDIFGSDRTRPCEFADLSRMQYLECTLKEVLRMFPVAPIFGREAIADVTLPSGHVIPKGCNVFLVPRVIHMNEKWFPEPLQFDPDRFLPDNARGRHPFAYVPFSAGVRSCIGQKYGMMFAKTVASTLMRNFSALPDPNGPTSLNDIKVTPGATLSMTNGSNIRLQHRR